MFTKLSDRKREFFSSPVSQSLNMGNLFICWQAGRVIMSLSLLNFRKTLSYSFDDLAWSGFRLIVLLIF